MLSKTKSRFLAGKTKFIIFSIAVYLLLSPVSQAQWQSDVRLTNNPAGSNFPFIAVSGLFVHVVWNENRDGNVEIYYKRSADGGMNWSGDTRLTNDPALSFYPFVAASGSNVHVVWPDDRNGSREVFYKRSTDNGVNWELDTCLSDNPDTSNYAYVASSGSNVHVFWYDTRNGNREIYYKRSTDNGTNWGPDTRLTNEPAFSWWATAAASGSNVHVVWHDNRDWNYEIYYMYSTNNGVNWSSVVRLTNNPAVSHYPYIAVSGSNVNVIWYDNRDLNYEVYYKRSTNLGIDWGAETRLTNNQANSIDPFIAASGGNVHVVWTENRTGNDEIFYKHSADLGLTWEADTPLTNSTPASQISSIAVSGSILHVVWQDNRNGNFEIYYKKNPTGNPIGIINISSEIPARFLLGQNYPNPFNPVTKIPFDISPLYYGVSCVRLEVFSYLGQHIETLVNAQLSPGTYEYEWNASEYPSGAYFYILTINNPNISEQVYSETKRMVLIK